MHGQFGLALPGESEQPQYGAIQLFFSSLLLPICTAFPCFHTTGCEAYTSSAKRPMYYSINTLRRDDISSQGLNESAKTEPWSTLYQLPPSYLEEAARRV